MLKIAGREADIVSIAPLMPGSSTFETTGRDLANSGDRIARQVDWIRQGAGARFDSIELSVFAHHVDATDDVAQASEELAAQTGTTPEGIADSPHVLMGPPSAMVEALIDRRERHGISYVIFDSADLDVVEPVVAQLAGR